MNLIKFARKKAGLTQPELAARIGISLRSLSRLETGKRDARVSELLKISRVFNCNIYSLLEHKNHVKTPRDTLECDA